MDILHSAHPGIVKMKNLARSYIWWPNMDREIEEKVNMCPECQETQKMPKRAPIHPWEWSRAPWTRLHLDFAGPMNGNYFLIVVDSYSKWLDVRLVSGPSAAAVVKVLRELFATHGIPDVCVSDNGTAFTSAEFQQFLHSNGIRQALVAPYHPSSNGQAERMVQNVKAALKKMSGNNILTNLSRYLLTQHVTPHSLTEKSPAEILMGRRLTTLLDKVYPDFTKEMVSKQEANIQRKPARTFQENDHVFARSYTPGEKWTPSTIVEATGPLSYKVATPDGRLLKRHTDQLRSRIEPSSLETNVEMEKSSSNHMDLPNARIIVDQPELTEAENAHRDVPESVISSPQETPFVRPSRVRQAPRYLEDYVI